MVLSILFYAYAGYTIAVETRSIGVAAIAFLLFHPMFYHEIIGIGMMSESEFECYYALAYLMMATLGWLHAWSQALVPIPTFEVNEKLSKVPKKKKEEETTTAKTAIQTVGQGKEEEEKLLGGQTQEEKEKNILRAIHSQNVGIIWRLVMTILTTSAFIATTLLFELLPSSLYWLGFTMVGVLLIFAGAIFYFAFAFKTPTSLNIGWKRFSAPFRCAKVENKVDPADEDMTIDVLIQMMIFYVPTWLFFGLMTALVPSFWWFYTITIIFGVGVVYFTMARWIWFNAGARLRKKGPARLAARQKAGRAME
jgi:hypothetical protein